MTRPGFLSAKWLATGFAVLLLLTGVYQASLVVMDGTGHLLTVEIVYDTVDPTVQGIALLDQSTNGTTLDTILSTYDPIVDMEPEMALDPYDGQPVIVWSRQDSGNFELAMVHRTTSGWGPLDLLTHSSSSDVEPKLIVDPLETAHIVWYPAGLGGAVYLQSFYVRNGHALGQPQRPLEPPATKTLKSNTIGGSDVGGGDDPGLIGGLTSHASANPCLSNPAAAPEHGVVLACGQPAAYQLSSCKLVVGVYDNTISAWTQTVTDLGSTSLAGTSVRDIAQSLANGRCN